MKHFVVQYKKETYISYKVTAETQEQAKIVVDNLRERNNRADMESDEIVSFHLCIEHETLEKMPINKEWIPEEEDE